MNHESDVVPNAPVDEPSTVVDETIAPPTRGWGEWAIAVAIAAAGVIVLVDGLMQKPSMSASGVGADFLPKIIGPLLIVLAAALMVQLFRGKYGEPEQAEGDVDLRSTRWVPLAVTVAALMMFVFAVEPVGYILTATVVFWIISWAMGARKYLTALLIGFIMATVIYYVFTRLLSIHLPAGFLENIAFLEGIL